MCQRRQGGEQSQAIGRSRGGRTTKIHALADGLGRPLAFLLTGGQAAACQAAEPLLGRVSPGIVVHADKGYDTDRVRRLIESRGSAPNIPPLRRDNQDGNGAAIRMRRYRRGRDAGRA